MEQHTAHPPGTRSDAWHADSSAGGFAEQVDLADVFPREGAFLTARQADLERFAAEHRVLVTLHQFSELAPGQSLQDHVRLAVQSEHCPHPSDEACLVAISSETLRFSRFRDLADAKIKYAAYCGARPALWYNPSAGDPPVQQEAPDLAARTSPMPASPQQYVLTPVNQQAEWKTFCKNIINNNGGRYLMRMVVPPGKAGHTEARHVSVVMHPVVLLDDKGRRFWAMARQVFFTSMDIRATWALRDHSVNTLTLFISTYVSRATGVILSQNATSAMAFGQHGLFNAETGLAKRGGLGPAQADTGLPSRPQASYNFLEMLFESRRDELQNLHEAVVTHVYRIDGLEIVNPLLRSWMGVQQGQEVFHDVQVASTHDPITTEQVYAISQIDVTDRILAQRQVARDKERMAAMVARQHDLIACLGKVNDIEHSLPGNAAVASIMDGMRRQMLESSDAMHAPSASLGEEIEMLEHLGDGAFGRVHMALFQGRQVAVKSMFLPLGLSDGKQRETMAMMEAAISSSLMHPNLVQTYTYRMQPVRQSCLATSNQRLVSGNESGSGIGFQLSSSESPLGVALSCDDLGSGVGAVTGFEVQLVLELCDQGSLRQALDKRAFVSPSGHVNYPAVLQTAMDIARGMRHLHSLDIVHSDLKPHNVLLQSAAADVAAEARAFVAKVADFGLSLKLAPEEQDAGGRFQGTLAYLAPEVYVSGAQSSAVDVYAFGVTLWELFTSRHPLEGIPRAMLKQQVVGNHLRPTFPPGAPAGYVVLAQRCWDPLPAMRPSFDEVLGCLEQLDASAAHVALPPLPRPSTDGSGAQGNVAVVDSPLERMLCLLETLQAGGEVDMSEVQQLHVAVLSLRDIRQPLDFAEKVRNAIVDEDVGAALVQLVSVSPPPPPPRAEARPRAESAAGLAAHAPTLQPVQEGSEGSPGSLQQGLERGPSASPNPEEKASDGMESDLERASGLLELLTEPSDETLALLATLNDWQFDCFRLADVTNGRPLSTMAFALLRRLRPGPTHGRVGDAQLARFLRRVEDGYRDCPYHNRIHATDVVRSMYVLLTRGGVLHAGWTADLDLVMLTALFAAIVHDYEHLGLNNDFLVRSGDPLALRYNDRSPMENHHLAAAFALLREEGLDFLSGMPRTTQAAFRKQVIDLVLATDMRQHFSLISLFNGKFGTPTGTTPNGTMSSSRSSRPSPHRGSSAALGTSTTTLFLAAKLPQGLDEDSQLLMLQVTLKCADLSHLSAAPAVHRRWAGLLEEEMFLQGDCERAAGLPVSALMDRHCPKGGCTRSQSGFFSFVAQPLFSSFTKVFPGAAPMMAAINENQAMWAAEGK